MKNKKKVSRNLKAVVHSLFFGLKGADEVISQSANYGGGNTEITQHKVQGGVLADMLEQRKTQEVKEVRDAYYRILREADKYTVTIEGLKREDEESENEESPISGIARKKTAADYLKHTEVYNEEGYHLVCVQDNKMRPKESPLLAEVISFTSQGNEDVYPLIEIERDGFQPRFPIEYYAKRIVVRKKEGASKKVRLDLYTSMYASQFGKVDALLIAELNKIKNGEAKKSDTIDFKSLKFTTDKAFGVDDLLLYEFNNVKFVSINVFDGNFVLTFDADAISFGEDIVGKYKTKELTEKYKTNALKSDTIDLFTLKRHIDEEEKNNELNLESTTIKL